MVGLATAAALVVVRLVRTQIYNEPWTIDPWLYTALTTNFDFVFDQFGATYYVTRLPAILPGYLLNSFLTPQQAYVVTHLAFFLAGALFLYLLVRTLFGVRVATLLYPALLTNAIYVDAHTWDYVDGFVITYLSGGLYFLASCIGRPTRIRPALAGLFFAAAALSNPFATLVVIAAAAAYIAVRWTKDHPRPALKRIAVESAWFLMGAGVLLVACGLFARAHGGRFLFFMPSFQALSEGSSGAWKAPDYRWMRSEPRLLVPGFVALVTGIVWQRRRRSECESLGLVLTVAGTFLVLLLALWEFFRSGSFLQREYYFDQLYPLLFVMLAAAVFALFERGREVGTSVVALAGIGLLIGAVPLVIVYGIDEPQLWGVGGSKIVIVLMIASLLLAVVVRLGLARGFTPALALVAAALTIGSVGYASASNTSTYLKMANHGQLAEAGDVFSIGVQLMDFMKSNGLQDGFPAFWYDATQDRSFVALHSLYYYGFTLVSTETDVPASDVRARLIQIGANHVITLCVTPCDDAVAVGLRDAGFAPVLVAARRLVAGSQSVWVEAYELGA